MTNFVKAIRGNNNNNIFFTAMLNSLLVAITCAVTTVFFSALCGYGLAKFRFKGRNVVFMAIMSTMMIPTETLKSVNFAEVCKYCNKLNICYATEPGHLMNLNKFNSLPEEYQAVFDDPEIIDLVETSNMEGFKKVEAVAMEWAEETYGTQEVILSEENLDAFYQIMADANVATAEELDAKGLPGTDMLNSLKEWSEEFNETGTIAAAGLD